jgi:hypothetical protein
MSRPKGSLNKKTIAKLQAAQAAITGNDNENSTMTPAAPAMSPEDMQAEAEYNAELNRQDETLDTLYLEVDATMASVSNEDITLPERVGLVQSLYSLMFTIHSEVDSIINAKISAENAYVI